MSTPDDDAETMRSYLAAQLNIAPDRIEVSVASIERTPGVPWNRHARILIDGKEPEGPHREALQRFARAIGGKISGEA